MVETSIDSPEQERPPSLPAPVPMMFPKMLDVSSVKLRSRDPPQKSSPDDSKEEQTPAKPAWMRDLKSDNRRSVGIFLERQELSNIRYLCAVVNVNVRKEFFCRQNIFKVSFMSFRQKEAVVTSPPLPVITSQSLRSPLRNNKFSKVSSENITDETNSSRNGKFSKVSSSGASDDVS